jgi:hypothetical protein
MFGGRFSRMVYPLICVDINLGIVDLVIMHGMKTKDVYIGVIKLQHKHRTKSKCYIQMRGLIYWLRILVRKKTFIKKLYDILGIQNNLPTAQFRNYCESFVKITKKMIKQGIQEGLRMQMKAIEYRNLELILEGAARMVNQVPYLDGSNQDLISLAHFLNPAGRSSIEPASREE